MTDQLFMHSMSIQVTKDHCPRTAAIAKQ